MDVEFADGSRQSIYPDYEIQTADANIIATQPTSGWVTKTKIAEIQDKEIESVTLKYIFQYVTGAASFRYAKLEFGEIATPWSPAPEDTAIAAEAPALDQLGTFNKLTNNGQLQGIYMSGGQLYINGSYIRAGTIDASQVNVTNLNANNITTGHLSADYLQGGTIDASKINVTNLNADNIKSGTITGRAIRGGTIEGAKIISRSNGTSVQVYDSKFLCLALRGHLGFASRLTGTNPAKLTFGQQMDSGPGKFVVTETEIWGASKSRWATTDFFRHIESKHEKLHVLTDREFIQIFINLRRGIRILHGCNQTEAEL